MIEKLKLSIFDAENLRSSLTNEAMAVSGFTSVLIRHLLNNLGALSQNYLEIGVHKGGTFCSTLFRNRLSNAVAIDNYTEFNEDHPKDKLLLNVERFKSPETQFTLINEDCFVTTKLSAFEKFDLFLYDGNHSPDSQYKACHHFLPFMTDAFVFLVDDYSAWKWVKEATQKGIEDSGCKVLFERELWNGVESDGQAWHNGFYVALLTK